MVQSGAIWNDDLVVGTRENILKSRTLNGAFWRYLIYDGVCFYSNE